MTEVIETPVIVATVSVLENKTVVIAEIIENSVIETSGTLVVEGTPGRPGPSGASRLIYTFDTPLLVWIANHSYPYRPQPTVIGTDGRVIDADYDYPTSTSIRITFGRPTAGVLEI